MSPELRTILVRSVAILVPLAYMLVALGIRRPSSREAGALLLAFLWNVPTSLLLNIAAQYLGWWTFHAAGGLFYGVPLDLLLGWAILWGPLAGLAILYISPVSAALLFLALDLLIMPACTPVVELGSQWPIGEAVALVFCLLPSLYLVRWTTRRQHLPARALMQMLIYIGLFMFLVPATAVHETAALVKWNWTITPLLQLLLLAALPGISALQEFVTRGGGTPFPYDPTQRLVATGPYAYVRNPMQLSTVLMFLVLAPLFQTWTLLIAGAMTLAYSAGLAWWHETLEFDNRFGDDWQSYKEQVPLWVPRLRPWRPTPAILYIDFDCDICQQVRKWFVARSVIKLDILPARQHPSRHLSRISYQDGAFQADGIRAISRALEHISFPWAMVGFFLRLPLVSGLFQLISDSVIPPHKVFRSGGSAKGAEWS